jgi:DNA mismatch repair protein MutL
MKPNRQAWEELYQVVQKDEEIEEESSLIFSPDEVVEKHSNTVVLQLQNRYGLSRSKNGCMLIDLKRAHLRIVYDQLIHAFMAEPLNSQQLLFPIEIELNQKELSILQDIERKLERLGFQWEIEQGMVRFFGAPSPIGTDRIEKFIQDILNTFENRDVDVGEILHELVVSLSNQICFQGDKALSQDELNQLIQDLFSCEAHSFDPKGRKIIKLIEIKELTHDF